MTRVDDPEAQSAGPTQHTPEPDRWMSHPRIALALRALIFTLPVAAAFTFSYLAGRRWPADELGIPVPLWWAGLIVASTIVMVVVERLARRALPIVALLQLSLIFPDRAPSRFGIALRTGTTRQLRRRIDTLRSDGLEETDATRYAEQMLELVAALSRHDRLTRGHCERVRAYTDLMIEEMGITGLDADRLRWCALLHDIGKLLVPAEILNSDDLPTEEQWETLKKHTIYGQQLVEPLGDWLGPWRWAVGQHHERWDGAGYPYGLSGTQIHLGARIVAVVDAYDVMTSARSYKKAISPRAARAELARCASTQFDTEVVRAFLNISIGRLRLAMGPLTTLVNVTSVAASPIAPTATPVLASGAFVALGAAGIVSGTINPGPEPASTEVSESVAFTDTEPAVTTTVTAPPPSTAVLDAGVTAEIAEEEAAEEAAEEEIAPTITATPPVPTLPPTVPPTTVDGVAATNVTLLGGTTLAEDTSTIVELLATGAGQLEIEMTTPATYGTARVTGTSLSVGGLSVAIGYAPDADFHGTDLIGIEACGDGGCVTTPITLAVSSVNDAPVARVDDTLTVREDEVLVIDTAALLGNDYDIDGDGLEVVGITTPFGPLDPATAWLALPADHDDDFTLTYVIADGAGETSSADVDVDVTPVNDAPRVNDDASSGPYGTDQIIDVLANDTDVEGDALTVTSASSPHGSVSVLADGRLTFRNNAGRMNTSTIDYTVRDANGATTTGRVTVALEFPEVHYGPAGAGPVPNGTRLHGATVSGSIDVWVDLSWTDSEIAEVSWWLDGVNNWGTQYDAPFELPDFDTTAYANGAHTLRARILLTDGWTYEEDYSFQIAN